ncbi:3-hydroxyisobutyryl-CoA hydrolase [Coemansia sp. RSA 1853]|nr:3-hydroxyisobutyryl-CoA hydrolase [Coemansia sp. RSA 638]KAJ2545081.1 3-hydroxyisobutyryl-CoA hydrolase [Coemansia sp. RSA 1853]
MYAARPVLGVSSASRLLRAVAVTTPRQYSLLAAAALAKPRAALMAEKSPKMAAASRLVGIQRMLTTQETREGEKLVLGLSNLTGRTMVLNRPKALNSLTLPMVQTIQRYLADWEKSDLCDVVMLRSNNRKAFCAGGDVVQVSRDWREGNKAQAMEFFRTEYKVNHHIATYKKPIVAMLDGFTMGGGVGLSVHAPFRVASENAVFAMPETKIGFFPDVGATFFLPRLDGELGVYLGLTGQKLKGRDLLYAGIATHYVPSERHALLEQRLQGLGTSDYDAINLAIEEFAAQPETTESEDFVGVANDVPIDFSLASMRDVIDICFKFNTIEAILQALSEVANQPGPACEWAQKTYAQLNQMSPSSLKLTLEQLRRGAQLDIQKAFEFELVLAGRRLESHDMHEGIDALLVRKTNDAAWDPENVHAVDIKELYSQYFEGEYDSTPLYLGGTTFMEYPHKFGLPTEQEILDVVSGESPQVGKFSLTCDEVIDFFMREYQSKMGVEQKVNWVLSRRTKLKDTDGTLEVIDS